MCLPSTRTRVGRERACAPNTLPVRRWQARQWQMEETTGSPSAERRSWSAAASCLAGAHRADPTDAYTLAPVRESEEQISRSTGSGYGLAQLEELDQIAYEGCTLCPARHHFGIRAFGVNAWTAADVKGDWLIPEHEEESGDAGAVRAARGRAVFELDGERHDAPAGTLVYVQAGVKRTAFAEEGSTAILAVGATPGKAYVGGGWELWAEAPPALRGGRVRGDRRLSPRARRGLSRGSDADDNASPAWRRSPAARPTRSSTCGGRSSGPTSSRLREATRTSMRSATSPLSAARRRLSLLRP